MNLFIDLKPFTSLNASWLGRRFCDILRQPANYPLQYDFPNLHDNYRNPRAAIDRVQQLQENMANEPTFAVLGVFIGRSPEQCWLYGATTMNVMKIPGWRRGFGPRMVVWLDSTRPRQYHGIGRSLLERRIQWLIANAAFIGRPWTVIRPDNKGSWPVWAYDGLTMTFEQVGRPRSYADLDAVRTPRQLFIATQPLEALRQSQR